MYSAKILNKLMIISDVHTTTVVSGAKFENFTTPGKEQFENESL